MRQLVLLVVTLGLLSGCTGEIWYVDSRFSPDEEQMILAAHEDWVAIGAPPQNFVFGQHTDVRDTGRKVIVKAGWRAAASVFDGFRPEDKAASCLNRDDLNAAYQIVMVTEYNPPAVFQRNFAHELGHHYLGSEHSAREDALMFTTALVPGPTEEEARRLRGAL